MKTWSTYNADIPRVINNNLADNITWAFEVINDSIRYLVTTYYFNERSYTVNTVANTQFYNLPPQVKKLINVTVTIGSVVWQPKECPSRQYWDSLNVITFKQDFPTFFFVYNGQVGIFPIPSASGNVITMNYKTRIPDVSMADISTASSGNVVTLTNGSTNVFATQTVGTPTTFVNWMANNWIRASHGTTTALDGDNQWYQIASVTNGSNVVLMNPYTGTTNGSLNFTVGDVPILPEDYQDLPLYRLGIVYYTTRFPDPGKAQMYQSLWDKGMEALNDEFGSKTTSVVITDTDVPIVNPNLFVRTAG